MRNVTRGPCPRNLDGPQSAGEAERLEAIAHFSSVNPSGEKFAFKQYKQSPVRQQLERDYKKKCAYCESLVTHIAYADIDHFRPKGAYRAPNGFTDITPGYYWLASGWDNLFLSCTLCNRRSKRTLAGGGSGLVGKGTHFPLADESKRATGPGGEAREDPLLLNPNQIDVEAQLDFVQDGVVIPAIIGTTASNRGRRSIDIYGLQRIDLVERRGAHLRRIKATVMRYKRERDAFLASPNDLNAKERLEEAMREIREYLCCTQEYLVMTRQHVSRECPELVPLVGCTASSCIGTKSGRS